MTQVRLTHDRPIKIRRLFQFSRTSSLGLVIPSNLVDALGLSAGQYVKGEMDKQGNSFNVEKI